MFPYALKRHKIYEYNYNNLDVLCTREYKNDII